MSDDKAEEPIPEPLEYVPPGVLDGTIKPEPIDGIQVRKHPTKDQDELVATRDIPKGTIIGYVRGYYTKTRTRHSITETRTGRLVQPLGQLGKANHSCDPNTVLSGGRVMIAKEDITADTPITWDYRTTETAFSTGFVCDCGAANCCRSEIGPSEEKRRAKGGWW